MGSNVIRPQFVKRHHNNPEDQEAQVYRQQVLTIVTQFRNKLKQVGNDYDAALKALDRQEQLLQQSEQIELPNNLSPRELQVLEAWANNDISIIEVADKLCIHKVTAHQHMANARKALNVNTNQGAVKAAVKMGLFSLT